ncbi:MAG: flagellar basal body P-ring formation chaperone FlgA [Nevskia sp.]|nr:flagellar basal body P-ring formation chaperone FlgA [Nevskia sp.]
MNRPSLPLLPLLVGWLLCTGAWAADPQPLQDIRDAAQDYVAAHVGGGVKPSAAALDPRLRLPACGAPLESSGPTPNAGNAWSVAVHCPAPSTWTLYVPVRVSERHQVVVLTRSLGAGMPIPADALTLQERDVTTLTYGYVGRSEDAVGKVLRRPVPAGAALSPDAIGGAASVKRGQEITLVSEAGGIAVRASGKALSDGASGDRIKVENLDSHRVVEGVVRDADTVEVGI